MPTVPGDEAAAGDRGAGARRLATRCAPAALILVGERLAAVPGALPAAPGWPPRPVRGSPGSRAGRVTAARSRPVRCPTCCPAAARSPTRGARRPGDRVGRRAPARGPGPRRRRASSPRPRRRARGLVVGGVDPDDLPDPARGAAPRWTTPTSWSAWSCASREVTERADVVFPVAPVAREGRHLRELGGPPRPFGQVLGRPRAAAGPAGAGRRSPRRWTRPAGLALTHVEPAAEMTQLGPVGRRTGGPRAGEPRPAARPSAGQAVLATWQMLLDDGRMQDGERAPGAYRAQAGRSLVGRHRRRARLADGRPGHRQRHRRGTVGSRSRSPRWPTASSGCPATRPGGCRCAPASDRPAIARCDRSPEAPRMTLHARWSRRLPTDGGCRGRLRPRPGRG